VPVVGAAAVVVPVVGAAAVVLVAVVIVAVVYMSISHLFLCSCLEGSVNRYANLLLM
jgi:hypothetical protein